MSKLNAVGLLDLSKKSVIELVNKEISFSIDGEDYTADIAVKRLSYDESVELFSGKKADKLSTADIVKTRIQQTIFNADTKKLLFETLKDVGPIVPQILHAMYEASDEVNDFLGKQQMKHLKKMNSGASSSSTESEEEQLKKQNET